MADKLYRDTRIIPVTPGADLVFVASDNGDGTYTANVQQAAAVAPSNYAQETGGNLDAIAAALSGRLETVIKQVDAHAITAGTPFDLWTPASGKRCGLLGWSLSTTVAGSIIFKNKHSAAYTEFLRTPLVLANDERNSPPFGAPIVPGAANDVLALDLTVSGTVSGYVFGVEV